MNQEVDTVTQELALTLEEEMVNKEQEDRRETSFRVDATPQELESNLVEVVIHEDLAEARNEDDESVPHSLLQSMMPRGARGFLSPK